MVTLLTIKTKPILNFYLYFLLCCENYRRLPMKNILIMTLCVLMVACSSAPSMEESEVALAGDDTNSVDDVIEYEGIDDIEDVEGYESTDDIDDVNDISNMEDVVESGALLVEEKMSQQGLMQDEEIRALRLEIEELKSVIADLRNENSSMASGHDENFKMQDSSMAARPVDLVMRFSTMGDQKHWWSILEEAGIKDKFYSASKGRYIIFLGHFNDHKIAVATKKKIIAATGASTIEIITSGG